MLRSKDRCELHVSRLRSLYVDLLKEIEPESNATSENAAKESRSNRKFRSNSKTPPVPPEAISNAWRILSATGEGGGQRGGVAAAERDDVAVAALLIARASESCLVEILRSIGELVVFGEQNLDTENGTSIFDYFCEKNMIALLVDIVLAKPTRSQREIIRREA